MKDLKRHIVLFPLMLGLASLAACNSQSNNTNQQAENLTAEQETANEDVLDDIQYLMYLDMVEGHIYAGVQLYKSTYKDMARMHMKHPESEIYATLVPSMRVRMAPGFDQPLTLLAEAVENTAPVADVSRAHLALVEAINTTRRESGPFTLSNRALAIQVLIQVALAEYNEAVNESGDVVTPHEFQDSYGFLSVAAKKTSELAEDVPETLNPALKNITMRLFALAGKLEQDLSGARMHADFAEEYQTVIRELGSIASQL